MCPCPWQGCRALLSQPIPGFQPSNRSPRDRMGNGESGLSGGLECLMVAPPSQSSGLSQGCAGGRQKHQQECTSAATVHLGLCGQLQAPSQPLAEPLPSHGCRRNPHTQIQANSSSWSHEATNQAAALHRLLDSSLSPHTQPRTPTETLLYLKTT